MSMDFPNFKQGLCIVIDPVTEHSGKRLFMVLYWYETTNKTKNFATYWQLELEESYPSALRTALEWSNDLGCPIMDRALAATFSGAPA